MYPSSNAHQENAGSAMDEQQRRRTIAYFERLGPERVRLYTRVDCDRFLGDWQVRELAEDWLAAQDHGARPERLWRRLLAFAR